jgi:alpha-amylase
MRLFDFAQGRRLAASAALLLLISCGSSNAYAQRRRAVTTPTHEWARGAVFYEVFVRSFYDSNADGNGDFPGLTAKLDYISSLGVDAVWLMPVFESPSYHGYDATDYETIEHDYGTNADFQRFLDEAHRRNIRVILDFVMNHTSSDHPWFRDSASSSTSSKRNWYVWSATNPGWTQPWGPNLTWYQLNGAWYYGVFWSGMPDLNYRTPEVKAEMFRISREWLRKGVDGYRLDATRYLIEDGPGAGQYDTPETHQLLKDFSNDVQQTKSDAILVAENTVETAKLAAYFADVPMNFNFPLASAIVDGVNKSDATAIVSTIREMLNDYPEGAIDAPFLTNHDQTRIATLLNNNAAKLRDAAAILLTLPGAPFIYYGEELGMQNGTTQEDESKRTPMPWTASGGFTTGTPWRTYSPGTAQSNVAAETSDPQSLLSYYRNWIAARKKSNALLKGDIAVLASPASVLAFIRTSGNERVLVVHNLGSSSVTAGPFDIAAAGFEPVFADSGATDPAQSDGGWRVTLPAHASGAWRAHDIGVLP